MWQNATPRDQLMLNMVNILKNRELGVISGDDSVKNYHQTQVRTMFLKGYVDFPNSKDPIKNIEYVKGGKKSIFCIWSTINRSTGDYVLGEVRKRRLYLSPILLPTYIKLDEYIEDLSDESVSLEDSLVFVSNDTNDHGIINIWCREKVHPYEFKRYQIRHTPAVPLFCVDTTFHHASMRLVVGGESMISHMIEDEGYLVKRYEVEGKTMTVCFDDNKNVFFSAQSNGFVHIFDSRSYRAVYNKRAQLESDTYIVDSVSLEPNRFLVAREDNRMSIFDLRAMQTCAHFSGHVHSRRKIPLSFGNNLVCASGGDNIVRIWHVSGGSPIHEIMPITPGNQQRGWLCENGLKTNLYCFEGRGMRVFETNTFS